MEAWVLRGLQSERTQETRKPASSRGLGRETDSLPASAQFDSTFFISNDLVKLDPKLGFKLNYIGLIPRVVLEKK